MLKIPKFIRQPLLVVTYKRGTYKISDIHIKGLLALENYSKFLHKIFSEI